MKYCGYELNSGKCWNHAVKGAKRCEQHTPGYKPPLQKCQDENEKLKKKAKEPIHEESCPNCGEMMYFYDTKPQKCGNGCGVAVWRVTWEIEEEDNG